MNTTGKKRARLLKVSPWCCHCGVGLDATTATLEHIIPQSMGGTGERWNLTLACAECNHDRRSEGFFLYRQRRQGWEEDIWEGRDFYEGETDDVGGVASALLAAVFAPATPVEPPVELVPDLVLESPLPPPKKPKPPRRGQRYRELCRKADMKRVLRGVFARGMPSAFLHAFPGVPPEPGLHD